MTFLAVKAGPKRAFVATLFVDFFLATNRFTTLQMLFGIEQLDLIVAHVFIKKDPLELIQNNEVPKPRELALLRL